MPSQQVAGLYETETPDCSVKSLFDGINTIINKKKKRPTTSITECNIMNKNKNISDQCIPEIVPPLWPSG